MTLCKIRWFEIVWLFLWKAWWKIVSPFIGILIWIRMKEWHRA
jgi:hypothetical protein